MRPMILAELRMYILTRGKRARNHSIYICNHLLTSCSPLSLSLTHSLTLSLSLPLSLRLSLSLSLSLSLPPSLRDYYARYSGSNKAFMSWQLVHGRSFVFARTDWEYVLNTFSFGYAIGYHFIASDKGSCNGNFLGIGMTFLILPTPPPSTFTRIDR